jgi:hypothetical protein
LIPALLFVKLKAACWSRPYSRCNECKCIRLDERTTKRVGGLEVSPLTFILDIAIRGAYIASVAAMGLKHFSRLREFHLADVPTLGNAASGVGAILFSLLFMESRSPGHFFAGTACTPAALIFDWFDGRLARWRRHHSALGASWIRWPESSRSAWHRPCWPSRQDCAVRGIGWR